MLSGFGGFSSNFVMRMSPSTLITPKRDASSMGTWITETVSAALFFLWKVSISL